MQMNPPTNGTNPFLLGWVGALAGERIFIDGPQTVVGRDLAQRQIVIERERAVADAAVARRPAARAERSARDQRLLLGLGDRRDHRRED
jgi:hypothetical protein